MINSSLIRGLAYFPAKLYELGVRTRIAAYEGKYLRAAKLRTPVISIGNLTVGGTGKTPFAAYLARYLNSEGYETAILSRGYKRKGTGRVEVSNKQEVLASPEEGGDEPYLLAQSCPGVRVVVDADRAAAGRWLEGGEQLAALILDDGFQHLKLERDLNLVLIDATDPEGGGQIIPFGRLREPLTSLRRADAIVVTRSDHPFDQALLDQTIRTYCQKDVPVFFAYHDLMRLLRLDQPGSLTPVQLSGEPVAILSGVARPDLFSSDVEHYGALPVLRRDFPDHHRYDAAEFTQFENDAMAKGARLIVTTEKDAINLPSSVLESSRLPVYAARIEFRCEDEGSLRSLVLRAIISGKRQRKSELANR